MSKIKTTPLKVKKQDGIMYFHQIVQTPIGVAQIQVAVNEHKVREAIRKVAKRAGVEVSGQKVNQTAAAACLKGGLELAAVCGAVPGLSLKKTLSSAAKEHVRENYETDVEVDANEGTDDDEEDDAEGRRKRRKASSFRAAPPTGEEDEEEEEKPAPAAAGDVELNSPEDDNPPNQEKVSVTPGYVDIGPSTPNVQH